MSATSVPTVKFPKAKRVVGEFTTPDGLIAGIDAMHRAGYDKLETFTPYDMPELDARLGLKRSKIGWMVAVGGLCGIIGAYFIQWWANVFNYPLNIGGRPVHAVPAFIFPTFEGMVIAASFTAFFGLFAWLRLPKLWAPIDELDGFGRASVDTFWLAVGAIDSMGEGDKVQEILHDAGALHTFGAADV